MPPVLFVGSSHVVNLNYMAWADVEHNSTGVVVTIHMNDASKFHLRGDEARLFVIKMDGLHRLTERVS